MLIWGWVVEGAFEHDVLSEYSGRAVRREGTNLELKLRPLEDFKFVHIIVMVKAV